VINGIMDLFAVGSPYAKVDETASDKELEQLNQFVFCNIWSVPSKEKKKVRAPVWEAGGEFIDRG
jgi:hypothetical protein